MHEQEVKSTTTTTKSGVEGVKDNNARCDRCRENSQECSFAVSLRGLHGAKKIEALAAKSLEERDRHEKESAQLLQSNSSGASGSTPLFHHNPISGVSRPNYDFSPVTVTSSSTTPNSNSNMAPPSSSNRNILNMASPHSTGGRSSVSADGSGAGGGVGGGSSFHRLGSRPSSVQEIETTDVEDLTRSSNPLRLLAEASDSAHLANSPNASRAQMSGGSFKIGPISK